MKKLFSAQTISYLLIGGLSFVYVLMKAWYTNIVGDEAYTIMHIVPTYIVDAPTTANNHYINSFLIKLFYWFAPNTGFVARLPTVLSFLVYLYFAYRIVNQFSVKWIGYFCFFMLVANPFLLDFFSLARGYGLSLAFMMISLYYAIENIRIYSISSLTKSLIWAGVSVLSIFSMVYFWIALAFVLLLVVLLRETKPVFWRSFFRSLWIGLVLCCLIIYPILQVMEVRDLEYGGTNNVLRDSIVSVLSSALGGISLKAKFMSGALIVLLSFFLFSLLLLIILSYVQHKERYSLRNFFLSLLISVCVFLTVAYYSAGIRYPLGRNALFLYPLMIFFLSYCLADLKKHWRWAMGGVLTFLFAFNVLTNLKIDKTIMWPSAAPTTKIFNHINLVGINENRKVKIDHTGYFGNAFEYYGVYLDKYDYIQMAMRNPNGPTNKIYADTDYYVLYFDLHHKDSSANPDDYFADLLKNLPNYKGIREMSFPEEDVFVYRIYNVHSNSNSNQQRSKQNM